MDNMEKIHTTLMGRERIKKNLKYNSKEDIVEYCKKKITEKECNIYSPGKNWYCEVDKIRITINAYNYSIITAHIIPE